MMTIIISKGDIFDLSNSDISYPYIYIRQTIRRLNIAV